MYLFLSNPKSAISFFAFRISISEFSFLPAVKGHTKRHLVGVHIRSLGKNLNSGLSLKGHGTIVFDTFMGMGIL